MRHYGIVGPGALGLLWAAKLAPNHRVTLWGRSGPVSANYTLADAASSSLPKRIELEPLPEQIPDILLVTTKSYDALNAIGHVLSRWSGAAPVTVLFQNGVGSQEAIVSAHPALPIMGVATTEGANRPTQHALVHAGHGLTRLGILNAPAPGADLTLHHIANDFSAAGFATRIETDIRAALWSKLLINAGINAFTVLLDKPNGALLGHPYFEQHISRLSVELAGVSRAQGYPESPDAIETRIRAIAEATRENISSMLQDARTGRPTEIDHINGTISAAGRRHGIATPVNDMLWRAVKDQTPRTQ